MNASDEVGHAPAWLDLSARADDRPQAPRIASARVHAGQGLHPYVEQALSGELATVRSAQPGTRNDTLNKAAFAIGQLVECSGVEVSWFTDQLLDAALACDLPERESRRTIESGLKAGLAKPRQVPTPNLARHAAPSSMPSPHKDTASVPFTDAGNATRFEQHAAGRLIYVDAYEWLAYTGTHWERDTRDQSVEIAKETARSLYVDAAAAEDSSLRKDLSGWAIKSESQRALRAMIDLAASAPGLRKDVDELDSHGTHLCLRNGILDLETQELLPHDPAALNMRRAEASWNPEAQCHRFLAFLERVLPKQDEREFLQRWFGYSLGADTREQHFVFLHGSGANGKSVLVNTIADVFGSYAKATPGSTFVGRRPNAASNDLAALHGSRLVIATETDEGVQLSESVIKELTGGERVTARFLYKELFSYKPACTLTISGNHRPRIRGTDDGIWRRVLLVPFLVQIPTHERDRKLPQKLKEECDGILRWLVEGYTAWNEGGLNPPASVLAATHTYREDEDETGRFIRECTERVDPSIRVKASDLRARYETWCAQEGLKPASAKKVGGHLTRAGFERTKSGTVWWKGMQLVEETDDA